jgi:malate synthase
MSGSLFDFGLYFFHNAKELLSRGTGPYFYLPKMESHLEARLWNDVFNYAQEYVGVPRGTIRATCLIETLPAAYEMEEILYELRDHSSGLNAGRWDYIFSAIKKTSWRTDLTLPDRSMITMTVPFMRAYTELLVKTCHTRGAHAMGGMSAFIPSRRDKEVNDRAMAQVEADKKRESSDGFDGTWVAHPDLVELATRCFDEVLGSRENQKEKLRSEVSVKPEQLSDLTIPGGKISEAGFRNNVSVGLQYIEAWFRGNGAVAIFNLMEDAATAEISRAQLWQWVHRGAKLDDGRAITKEMYAKIRDEEIAKLGGRDKGQIGKAADLLDKLVMAEQFEEFLTLPAYEQLK